MNRRASIWNASRKSIERCRPQFAGCSQQFSLWKSKGLAKSKIRSIASHPSRAAAGRCLRGLPGCSRGCLRCQPIDVNFGLRTSGFFRHSVFGLAQSLVSPKMSFHYDSFQNENCWVFQAALDISCRLQRLFGLCQRWRQNFAESLR